MTVQPPPIYEILAGEDGKSTLPWVLFFNQLYDGDAGTAFTPSFTSLGSTGTPTITGSYYRLSAYLTFFRVTVTPATDTTSTAATTYFEGLPITINNTGFCVAVGGNLGIGTGIVQTNGRVYTPAWSAATVPVTILGFAEAS